MHRRGPVVGDEILGHPEIATPADALDPQRQRGWIGVSHRPHIGPPDEPLAALRELQHHVIVVDIVDHVLVVDV
jgi:hypothetical protein